MQMRPRKLVTAAIKHNDGTYPTNLWL
jgi:hypothetical protein